MATFWKGRKSFCETVVICDLGHDDDSVWQVQDFGCLGLIFRGRRNTLQTSTKISARNLAKTHFLCAQCFVKL